MFKLSKETISLLRLTHIAQLVILQVLAFGLSGPVPVGAQSSGPNPNDLQYLRSCHTATTLADGRVLVTGGYGVPAYNPYNISPQVLNVAEIYNPSTGVWTMTGSLKTARQYHTASLLPDGKVLVAGGDNGSTCLGSLEIYDPVSQTWSLVGNLITPRAEHTASLLANGTVLFAGGRGGLLGSPALANNNAEVFDFKMFQSRLVANLTTPRVNHTAVYGNNVVMVTGGFDDKFNLLKSYELFDADTGAWIISGPYVPELLRGHAYHTATSMPSTDGGMILWAGGYDGVDNTCAETLVATYSAPDFTIEQSYLNQGRLLHTATLVSNGKVVVAGGWNTADNSALLTTEVYDPKKKIWTPGNFLAYKRAGHTASLLATGEILLVGGYNDTADYLGAELYYPDQGLWWWPDDFGNFRRRDSHTATLLPNGKVLLVGGQDGLTYPSSAQLYTDNKFYGLEGTWTDTAPLTPARCQHTATLLPCGLVLVAGGETPTVLNSVRLYDPDKETWRPTRPLKQARYRHTATLLADGQVLVAGGQGTDRRALASTELYDPGKGTWTLVGPLNIGRAHHTAILLYNGQVMVTGGFDANGWDVGPAELYDPVSRTWSQVAPMGTPRDRHTATLLPNGQVLVAGGWDNNNTPLNSAELFDPNLKTWASTGNLHEPRIRHTATLLPDGLVLVAGGYATGDPRTFPLKAELYNPATGSWIENSALMMDNGRFLHTATLLNTGNVLLAGGYNDAVGTLGTYLTYTNILGLDPGYRPQIVSVQILPPPAAAKGLLASSSGSGFCLGVTLAATMSDFLVSQQLTQGTQLQLMALEDKRLLFPGIDTSRSTTNFLVTSVIEKAPEDIYQTIVSIGGIPSTAHLVKIGKGQVPPPINNVPATMLLNDK